MKTITKYIYILLFIISILFSINYYYTAKAIEQRCGKLRNMEYSLDLIRDFDLYQAIQENNISKIENNIKLNFMFHLSPLEINENNYLVDIQSNKNLCDKYNIVSNLIQKDYKDKYPIALKKLNKLCSHYRTSSN